MTRQISNWIFILAGALILAAGLFFVGYFIYKATMVQSPYGMANTVTVNGEGRTQVQPDMLVINVSVSELADTTEEAQAKSNEKMDEVRTILSWFSIAEKDIKTTSVNTYPEYDRSEISWRQLLGYRSQHNLSINVSWEDFWEKWGEIVDEISKIGWVNIDGTYFDLKDKNAALADARGKALEDAKTKAEQLAKASGNKLGKIVTITDNSYYNMPGPIYYAKAEGMGGVALDEEMAVSSEISPGETEVIVNVNVVYKIK